mmetsp:Transcript_26828/g.70513  ORF Transcript_26828/g.70513 Transcript_26828/m.70513 type:complete len:117 (-) Transcript_26828:1092-1442(-)
MLKDFGSLLAPVGLGLLISSAIPPFSDGSRIPQKESSFNDPPLMWTNVHSGDIILDARIRDWVLIPILIIMIFFNLIREHAARLLHSNPKPNMKTHASKACSRTLDHCLHQSVWVS